MQKSAVYAALLTLIAVPLLAAGSKPSRPFFAQMILKGVTFQVDSPNDSSINRVVVRAESLSGPIGQMEA